MCSQKCSVNTRPIRIYITLDYDQNDRISDNGLNCYLWMTNQCLNTCKNVFCWSSMCKTLTIDFICYVLAVTIKWSQLLITVWNSRPDWLTAQIFFRFLQILLSADFWIAWGVDLYLINIGFSLSVSMSNCPCSQNYYFRNKELVPCSRKCAKFWRRKSV